MRKSQTFTFILWLAVLFLSMSKIYATSLTSTMAEDLSFADETDLNYSSFEVNVNEYGWYYAEFWLMPAKYIDGGYTRFSVYANNEYIGNIAPTKGNWQSARIEGNERILLNKGSNIIKIATPAPEIPAVELVKVGLTDTEALISSKAYDSFYSEASTGMTYDIPEEQPCVLYSNETTQSSNAPEVSLKYFNDVPLKYTFHVLFKFTEGQEIPILTSGYSAHDVDIIYVGQKPATQNESGGESTTSYILTKDNVNRMDSDYITDEPPTLTIAANRKYKQTQAYDIGTSEELQGLNWKSISTESPGLLSIAHTTSKIIKIPKTGVYLIRLRHREPGKTGKANLFVNNRYAYPDVPISFTWLPCELPANGNEYGTLAKSSNPDMDDPMLFIHGAAADRVVGLGDDASLRMQVIHELSPYDSHVLQQYNVRTSGISVCNYFSNTPESSCYIIAGIDESVFDPGPEWEFMPKYNENPYQPEYKDKTFGVNISDQLEHCGVVTITSDSPIRNVTVTDLSGTVISSFQRPGNELSVSKELMNIGKSGVYIVSVETDNGIASKKLLFE